MRRISLFFLVAILYFVFSSLFSPKLQAQSENYSPDEVIVQYRPNLSFAERERLHRDIKARRLNKLEKLDVEILKVSPGEVEKSINILNRDPRVLFAEPNYIAQALEITNDPRLADQWGLFKIEAASENKNSAWNYTKSDSSVKIAILDTGIDQDHQDLAGKLINGRNCSDSPTSDDLYGHGTHVAGIAASVTNNGVGVAGVGYKATLLNVKVLGDDGSGYYSWIADCIRWAADNGAKVINMSLGGGSKSKTLENAVNYAWNKGVVVVAAAGNSGNSSPTYPGYYTNAIAVAATNIDDQKASWSSFGKWVDVAAPGDMILSTFPNHAYKINKSLNYDYGSGTSMATPFVSGLAALVWTTPYGTSNSSVRARIENNADKISGTGNYWRFGRINALKSVFLESPTPTPTFGPTGTPYPTPTITSLSESTPTPTSTPVPWWCARFPSWCN